MLLDAHRLSLRHALQRGLVALTKSVTPKRIRENAQLFDFELSPAEMAALEDALDDAEAGGPRAREVLLDRMVDQAIDRRGVVSALNFDPVIIRLQGEYEPFQRFVERLYAALLGTEAGVEARLHAAILSSAISVCVMHPLVADVDGDTLRVHLKSLTRRMLGLSE